MTRLEEVAVNAGFMGDAARAVSRPDGLINVLADEFEWVVNSSSNAREASRTVRPDNWKGKELVIYTDMWFS